LDSKYAKNASWQFVFVGVVNFIKLVCNCQVVIVYIFYINVLSLASPAMGHIPHQLH